MSNGDYDNNARTTAAVNHAFGQLGYDRQNTFVPDVSAGITVAEESASAASLTDNLHTMLDDLELRLFGPEPRAVEGGIKSGLGIEQRPALAHSVKATRQRLEHANDRLSRILSRV